MQQNFLFQNIKDSTFYLIGIKGTGMAAMAELLHNQGAKVSGSDVEEQFYTDRVLQSLGISYQQGFDPLAIDVSEWDYVIRSSAYPDDHPMVDAFLKSGKEVLNYTQALGAFSAQFSSNAIAGIHGKTTTTALAGTMVKTLGLTGSVLVGSAVANFGNRSTWTKGSDFFIAETCEYQRHFLDFYPKRILLTSVEEDHLDYFKDLEDIHGAFQEFFDRLPPGGELIYCADDPGAVEAARRLMERRKDICCTAYGRNAQGPFRIVESSMAESKNQFRLECWNQDFQLQVPGEHLQLNAAGSIALLVSIMKELGMDWSQSMETMGRGLRDFRGTRRRSEIIGTARDILVMDDYGHHPRAIDLTLRGYKSFYKGRRLVVSFMSHTYSRTASLINDFSRCFSAADCLILHDIYSSAREAFDGTMSGEIFYQRVAEHHDNVHYFSSIDEAKPFLLDEVKPGDLFVTLGAGNNWPLGPWLLEKLGEHSK